MTPDAWAKLAAILAPVSNLLATGIFLLGAIFSGRFRLAFTVIGTGTFLFLLSNLFWFAVSLERTRGISLLSRDAFVGLFPAQAICSYLAVAAVTVGDALLVWQACRRDPSANI